MRRAAALALCAVLAACKAAPPEGSAPAGAGSAGARKKIIFRHGSVSGFEATFRAIVNGFEKERPDARVVDEMLPWNSGDQHQLYAISLQGKSTNLDIMAIDIVWVAEFARAGWIADLSDVFPPDVRAEFLPGTVQAGTYQGKFYAAPWFTDAGMLYYRKDLLKKHGFAGPPETWPELVAMARKILAAENDPKLQGFVWQGKQYEGLVCNAVEYFGSAGAQFVDANGAWALDPFKAVQALTFMSDLVHKNKVSPMLVLSGQEEPTRQVFSNGQAVFHRNWPYAYNIFDKEDSPVKGKFGIAPLPKFPGGEHVGTLGGWFLAVNKNSPHLEQAKAFVRYMTSRETQTRVFKSLGYLPTRTAMYQDPTILSTHPHLAKLGRILETARPRPVTPYYMGLSEILQAEFSAVLAQLKTPKQAVRSIEKQAERLLALEARGGKGG